MSFCMPFVFFKGIRLLVLSNVYLPSDDSFLLSKNVKVKRKASVLDFGTGSGIQGINAAMQGAEKVVSTDINENSLQNAEKNAKALGFGKKFEFRKGSLFDCLKKGEKFDVIVFNPPYVISEERKYADLDGGVKGREVLDRFLNGFAVHLKKEGKCFFLQSSLNGEKKTVEILEKLGFEARVVARKRLFFEELLVFRALKWP